MVNLETNKKQLITELDDIRQRMAQLEQSVAEDEHPDQLLAHLFNSSPAATYVVQDRVFRFVSPQLRQMTSYYEGELLGTNPSNLVLPEDRKMVRDKAIQVLRGERLSSYRFRIFTKNGKIKWVIQTASRISYEGKPAIIASIVDITELKQAEQALQESEGKYHDLCENADDMIQCVTPECRLAYVNRRWRETLGYSQEEIDGLSLFEIVHPDYREHYLELFERVISGEQIDNVEAIFVARDGHKIMVEGSVNCKFADGKPVYTREIFRDVTKRKQAQEEAEALLKEVKGINHRLEQSNRELEDFAYIASHDLQEPLRKISSFGALLQDSLEGKLDEDQSENLDFMIDGAQRMQMIIDDLLAYSRITTKAKPFQPVDPNDVLENLKNLDLATALDETKGTILIPQPLLSVQGDRSQIHQLLQNLIGNGLKFHRKGIPPMVTIRSHRMQNNMVRFYVIDNGIGINEEYHEQIFVMFKRLHSRASYSGTGIGLAICKKIAQRHGGEIGIKSTPSEGSTFWFTLPRVGGSGDNGLGSDGKHA